MFNLLVTGSSGYLGSQFIKQCAQKYRISQFSLQSQSLEDIDFDGLDAVLHCAGIVHQGQNVSSSEYDRVNTIYPVEMARLAKANGLKQFVFISSVSVYGPMEYIDEDSDCNPRTKYGKSKLEAENRLFELNDSKFIVSILRIPMIYGPQAPGNIQSIIRLVNYLPIIPLGNINNRRSFISIRNLVYSIMGVLNFRQGGVFLLADDEPISTSILVSILITGIGKNRLLLDSGLIRALIRFSAPSVYEKLWGNMVINCSVSKRLLSLDFPVDIKVGLTEMFQLK
jgi:nucleoside-diphosphate-sugar epimerase